MKDKVFAKSSDQVVLRIAELMKGQRHIRLRLDRNPVYGETWDLEVE